MNRVALLMLSIYRRYFSPTVSVLFPFAGCRFTPTCSDYTRIAVSRYGIIKGLLLGLGRILRCHPGNHGGHDPVPQFLKP